MIQIITTGGTIEGLEYDNEKDKPENSAINIVEFLETANVAFEFEIDIAFKKDSRFITRADREVLAKKIKLCNHDRVLITHGTLTMIETAKFLGNLNLEKTIVLVGSFISGSDDKTDAPFNLGYALCSVQFLSRGVYIAMNGGIFGWRNVVKTASMNQFIKKIK